MVKVEANVDFGKEYRDTVSEFTGKVVAISQWQYGCVRIGLQGKVKDDGNMPEVVWFDEEQLKGVEPARKSPGGPTPSPMRNTDPHR